ncbi:MAG: hypothetical protein K6B72_05185 [Lachnospiraceae bacterium]|nr:hypothetical protein [Lachnospiraceae bacterium]
MSLYNKIIDLQKLRMAWDRVRKNKPVAGVDEVTCEQFEEDLQAQLKQLQTELLNHTYRALPVKQVMLYKGEKARAIALYAMRDKVVQQSLAAELDKIYDSTFSERTCAYRSGHSALAAVEETNEKIREGSYSLLLKLDITHFFDEINWDTLRALLARDINEEDVLELIRENTCSHMLDEKTGELIEKRKGIYQGSAVSPILSNLYLRDFDHWLQDSTDFFIRYSDDLIVLGNDRDQLLGIMSEAARRLEALDLRLNDSKSVCVSIEEGADFLGYHFNAEGKTIPAKARENLTDRLESMWLTIGDIGIEDKLAKASEIIGGWEQYYRENREVSSILELAGLLRMAGDDEEKIMQLMQARPQMENVFRDVMLYLSEIWKRLGERRLELLEYEQFFQVSVDSEQVEDMDSEIASELLDAYRRMVIMETEETATEIMQDYTDLGCFGSASAWQQRIEQMAKCSRRYAGKMLAPVDANAGDTPIFDDKTAAKLLRIFGGREDIHSRESIGPDHRRKTDLVTAPLTDRLVTEHLRGEITLGTYIQRPNATVRTVVFDVDISKRVMLGIDRADPAFAEYMKKAFVRAVQVCDILDSMGLRGYIELSGNRGYHVWLLMTEWMPTRYANMLCECIETKLEKDEDITVEFFPNKTRIKAGKFGQVMKLPYGIHLRTGKRSYFLDEDGQPILEINPFVDNLARFTIGAVKKVLAMQTGNKESAEKKEVDQDLSAFGDLESNVCEVLKKCDLMRYLCQRAVKTGYLNHFERLSILHVFGHLGEAGQQFVHQVMSHTLNYSYNVTESFVRRCPEKPISCVKLRDQYRMVTAEIGCDCAFKRTKNCYPSPVLHAITGSEDADTMITLPTSRTLTEEKKSEVMDEINIHKKAQSLAKRILELRKQQRSLTKSIKGVERELSALFDNAGIDALETDLGMLVRRKKEDGYEWLIEI